MRKTVFFFLFACSAIFVDGQGLEGVFVETYYVVDENDQKQEGVSEGMKTYRIYVDLEAGYALQAVFGSAGHEMSLSTTTEFYNSQKGGASASELNRLALDHDTDMLDSYITLGFACNDKLAVPKKMDTDGSLLAAKKKSGLRNSEYQIQKKDGLLAGPVARMTTFGLDLTSLGYGSQGKALRSDNGAWAVLGGVQGPTEQNLILIAQVTTDGELSYALNLQIGFPDGAGSQRFVATDPANGEILFQALTTH